MAIIRQSDLASFSYCGTRQGYEEAVRAAGGKPERLSATIYGTVMHFALEAMQRLVQQGREDARDVGIATFLRYWDPAHTHEISEGAPTIWANKQTYGGLRNQGQTALIEAYDWMTKGKGGKDTVLATEYTFDVPVVIDGVTHTLHGTIDRLGIRNYAGVWYIAIDDWKSGIKPDHLQHGMQWTVYSYATEDPDFWDAMRQVPGFDELERRLASRGLKLHRGGDPDLQMMEKRGRWLSVKNGQFRESDAGIRTNQHYARMRLAIQQYLLARLHGVRPVTMDTKKCVYCPFAKTCGGAPIPELQIGVDVEYFGDR